MIPRANGFSPFGGQDAEGFSFWPLERITRVCDYRNGLYGTRADMYLFADYLDWSWAYALTLEDSAPAVFIIGTADGEPQIVAASLDEFIDFYLVDDPSIYAR